MMTRRESIRAKLIAQMAKDTAGNVSNVQKRLAGLEEKLQANNVCVDSVMRTTAALTGEVRKGDDAKKLVRNCIDGVEARLADFVRERVEEMKLEILAEVRELLAVRPKRQKLPKLVIRHDDGTESSIEEA